MKKQTNKSYREATKGKEPRYIDAYSYLKSKENEGLRITKGARLLERAGG